MKAVVRGPYKLGALLEPSSVWYYSSLGECVSVSAVDVSVRPLAYQPGL